MTARAVAIMLAILCGIALLLPAPRYVPTQNNAQEVARAQQYIEDHWVPLPESWLWGRHPFEGGELRWGEARQAETPRGTLIVVPGFRGYTEAYAPWINEWYAAGFDVVAVDLPGQGLSTRRADNPEKPWTGDFSLYGDILSEFIRARVPDAREPVTLVGESFGGHVALRAVAEQDLPIERLALIVPGLEFNTRDTPKELMHRFTAAATTLGFGHRYAPTQNVWVPEWDVAPEDAVCALREERAYLQEALFTLQPDYRVGGLTNEWANGFERSGLDLVESELLSDADLPVLMVMAGQDRVIVNDRNYTACNERLPDCQYIEIKNSGHCMLFEEDEVVTPMIEGVIAFADKQASPPRSNTGQSDAE
ncbi:MAG: alpha/beta hydrolase [Pseudomonadota bacterium]